jgi:FixJ family two-component response regulator
MTSTNPTVSVVDDDAGLRASVQALLAVQGLRRQYAPAANSPRWIRGTGHRSTC